MNGQAVDPENGANQQQPTQEPKEWVRRQPIPLVGIPEPPNIVQCELSQHLFSFFRVAQPLGIHHELPSTPPQCEEVQDGQYTEQQKLEQRILLASRTIQPLQ
jgi:hypothetical protein